MRKSFALGLAFFCAMAVSARTTKKKPDIDYSQFQKKLAPDDQILHALDRLTFGPRPGDVAQVKKIGLKKWIDLQLHPERIQESADLEAKLQPLESLRMTPLEAVQHYPSPRMIVAIARGRQPMPDDPLLRASVERMIQRYKARKDADAQTVPAFDPNVDLDPAKRLNEVLDS